jgi:hypothetical protein
MSDWKPNAKLPSMTSKRLNPLNLKQGEWSQSNNAKTTTLYYHTKFTSIFQIYIDHKTFLNEIPLGGYQVKHNKL